MRRRELTQGLVAMLAAGASGSLRARKPPIQMSGFRREASRMFRESRSAISR